MGVQIPPGGGTFKGGHAPAHHNVPTAGDMPVHRMRRTNAFNAARGDKMAMRPLAKLLLTLVLSSTSDVKIS